MITCAPISLLGLSNTGFISVCGASLAAWACTACARPISPPSAVTALLSAMFCGLNGATATFWRASQRHSAVTRVLLPASEVVPWTIKVLMKPFSCNAPARLPAGSSLARLPAGRNAGSAEHENGVRECPDWRETRTTGRPLRSRHIETERSHRQTASHERSTGPPVAGRRPGDVHADGPALHGQRAKPCR